MDEVGNGVELWVVLAAAFGSALLGAVVGFGGSLYLTVRADKARKSGVVRAVLAELATNSTAALMATAGPETRVEYSRSVWDDGKFEIAQWASNDVFSGLMGIYSILWLIQGASERVRKGDNSGVDSIEVWYETIRKTYNKLLAEEPVPSVAGWPQMESFSIAVAELQRKLASSSQEQSSKGKQP